MLHICKKLTQITPLAGLLALTLAAAHPASAQATFNVTVGSSPGTVNFTTQGTSDWAHYGNSGVNGTTSTLQFDHKAVGGTLFSNVSSTNGIFSFSPFGTSVSWTDGTPTATSTNNKSFEFDSSKAGIQFTTTVPAGQTGGTLNIYAITFQTDGLLSGTFSGGGSFSLDTSTVGLFDGTTTANGHKLADYVVNFSAPVSASSQTLTLAFKETGTGGGSANVGFYGATLALTAAPEPSPFAAFAVGLLGLGALSLRARRRRAA